MRKKRKQMKINGLPVKNGKSTLVLAVNATDIKKASLKDPGKCAAAIASCRALGASEARVHVGRTYLRFNNHWERYLTSKPLRAEIVAFDRGGKFEPGEYHLIKMDTSHANRGKQGTYKKKPQKEVKKRRKCHVLTNIRPMGLAV